MILLPLGSVHYLAVITKNSKQRIGEASFNRLLQLNNYEKRDLKIKKLREGRLPL